jgi:hypothetical protein
MINSGNTYITEIHYQGYTIKKVYACNGELVWGQDGLKYKGEYSNGEVFTLNCDGDPEITMMDVQIDAPSIANLSAATFYPCAEYLGYEVLGAADNLKRVEMLEGVKSIGQGAFNHSSALTEVIIPDSVTSIGSFSFKDCDKLSALTIGSGVTYIGSTAFSGCSSLNNDLDFPNIDRINASAFRNCSKLHSVTLGSGCTRIEENAFTNCTALTSVTVEAITPPYCAPLAFDNTTCTIYVPCDSVDTYKTTYAWNSYASRIIGFGCPTPKWKATYSDSSTTSADCDSTSAITQNEINLTNLVSVEIGDCVTEIGDNAFTNCTSLTSCTIGSGVTTIGYTAFTNCTSLTSITINAVTPPELMYAGKITPFYNTNDCPIYVPSESVSTYQFEWTIYSSRIQAIQ